MLGIYPHPTKLNARISTIKAIFILESSDESRHGDWDCSGGATMGTESNHEWRSRKKRKPSYTLLASHEKELTYK